MRLSTYDKPRIIACAEDHPRHIGLPRGCLDEVHQALSDLGVRTAVRDERCVGRPLEASFRGELRPEQISAAEAMLAHDTGVLAATTAFGKTVVAAWLVARRGVSTLVLVHRRQLLDQWIDRLEQGLAARVRHLVVLRAGLGRKQRQAVADRITAVPRDEARVVLATGKYVGEGFDDPRLDTLFLTLPVSWRGTIAQYAGRLHRLYDGKREVRIYDYADLNVPMLARMFDRRCHGYEVVGYTILLPASALPGWPNDVPLPSDPVWKRDYSGSVRRLVRDGVGTRLATLFAHVARPVSPDADGADRARSATEAFIYRRLETLAETKGRFRLNVALPIAFDGLGQLEVDLLCADARVAVELDGAQHLADPVVYRRDRRKDLLLQENGYRVLRFLAEDVGKEWDFVLDTILRALRYQRLPATTAPLNFVRGD